MKRLTFFIFALLLLNSLPSHHSLQAAEVLTASGSTDDQLRLKNVLEWVWATMNTEYYEPVSKDTYDKFVSEYTADRVKSLNNKSHQTEDFVHLGAGLLIQKLKKPTDRFSNFVPPKKAVAFKQEAYAARADLGLEGRAVERGYELTRVQKHCPAAAEWISAGDIILAVNGTELAGMEFKSMEELLKPEAGSQVTLNLFFKKTGNESSVTLTASNYFAETIEMPDSGIEGVFILKISHFNEKTGADAAEGLAAYGIDRIRGLIVDLRENKGGPPLATRDILGMFTPPNDPLFIIARRSRQPVLLSSAASEVRYAGPITVLTSGHTASAAETLAGVLREKLGASIVGTKTYGACYLKSMYDYTDGSTMLLVTSKTYFHNRKLIPEDGIQPDVTIAEGTDSLTITLDSMRSLRR